MSIKFLNATYTDIPAPNLVWEEMPEAPVPRLDGAAVQIKDLLYVFSGYGTIDYVRTFEIPVSFFLSCRFNAFIFYMFHFPHETILPTRVIVLFHFCLVSIRPSIWALNGEFVALLQNTPSYISYIWN